MWPTPHSAGKSAALILAATASVFAGRAQSRAAELDFSKDPPVLELDLREFGYDTSGSTNRLQKYAEFTGAKSFALAWLTLDDPAQTKKRGPRTVERAKLHVLVLDALAGRKQASREWPTPSNPVRVSAAREGELLTCTGNVLRLLTPALEIAREQKLPLENGCRGLAYPSSRGVSPSGRSLLVSSVSGPTYKRTLLDVDTFALTASWNEGFPTTIAISDQLLLGLCNKPREVCTREIDGPWRPLKPFGLDKKMTDARGSIASFVNETTLVLEAWNHLAVLTTEPAVEFQVELPKNRSFGEVIRSNGGERFAVIENRQRGVTSEPLNLHSFPSNDRVVVYSIPDHRAIYMIKISGRSPLPPYDAHQNFVALSPDGILLAVVSDGLLRVYRLPELKSQTAEP